MNSNHDTGQIDSLLTIDTSVAPPLGGATNSLTIAGTGALVLPNGTTAQQPAAGIAQLRYDSTINELTWSDATNWYTLSTGGTVTSVAFSDASTAPIYTISGSPITTNGTLTVTLATQTANKVFVAPNGSTGQPSFRVLATADIPSLSGIYLPLAGGSMTSGANITMSGGGTITGLPTTPAGSSDATSKAYVDATASSLNIHNAVEAASTTALTATYNNGSAGVNATLTNSGTQAAFSIDGYPVSPPIAIGTRVLIKNQGTQTQNGVYTVTNAGSGSTNWVLTRATDFDNSINNEVHAGSFIFVTEGSTQSKTGWVETFVGTGTPNDQIVFGTDNLIFTQFSGAGTYAAITPITLTGSNFALSGLSGYGTSNQVIGMNNAAGALEYKTVSGGTAISVANTAGTITINNTGVTSLAVAALSQASITVSASTGSLTLTTDPDLDAYAALATIGIVARTGAGTVATRTITGTSNQITVSNGDGVAGVPVLAIANNVVLPGTGSMTIVSGTSAQQPAAGAGLVRYDTTINSPMWSNATTWSQFGTVTSVGVSGGTTGLTTSGGPITSSGTITIGGTLGIANGGTGTTAIPTNGQLHIGNGTNFTLSTLTAGTGVSITNGAGTISINNTGVTSVGFTDASTSPIYSVTNSPVTTTGTLTITLATQTTNKVFAAPNGSTGQPSFRALAYADLPVKLYIENPSSPTTPLAAGTNAVAIGSGSSASGTSTYAVGTGTNASIYGSKAYANGNFTSAGDAQSGMYILRNITANAAPLELFLDGATGTQRLILSNNSVWTFKILIAARRTDAVGGGSGYSYEGVIRKDASSASTTLVGNPSKVILGETNAGWDVTLSADTTNGSLKLTATGEAAKTIRWVATVITVEVTN